MIVPTRLFDFLDKQIERFNLPDAMAAKEKGLWRTYSSQELFDTCQRFSAGLLQLGLSQGNGTPEGVDKIAIISNNRPEWLMTDMACQQIGVSLCPIYPTTNVAEIAFIFNDAAVKYVFVSDADLYQKISQLAPSIASLKGIYSFDRIEGVQHWSDILALSTPSLEQQVLATKQNIAPSQIATIIYTSGTTGTPKGVMLSHQNIVSNVLDAKASFPFADSPGKKVLSFLPLNHIFERTVSYIYLASGISIYYAQSLETIGDDLKEVKPNGFTTVPRLLEKVYEKIMAKGEALRGIKRQLFFWSVDLGLRYDNINGGGWLYNMKLSLARKLIFSKWKAGLGGNIEFIITGGAACQERLLRVFNAAEIPVFEGYGPTENSPVVSVNRQTPGGTMFGTVGPPLNGQTVKLAEDGEILVKGSSVMMGYYKRPDLTAETIKEGWLLTGDIGVWVNQKFLKITDRKKELFKTSGGKYVAPQPIENKLKESAFIEQVLVVGAEKKFVGALIVPAFGALREWMRQQNIPFTTNEDAILNPQVHQHYRQLVEGFNVHFNHVEQIKKFELMPREWSIDSGEMTPKMSLKRKVIMEKYHPTVERIYA
ncbi:MAG: long-chain fatty acid--CoA ligase [Bacteroidetes bacterium]|nr:MAG: long-chain fatty acid--CoA ligase [Bacteroidota bacterium]